MTIRALTAQDAQDATTLYDALVGGAALADAPSAFARVIAHPGTSILGAEVDGHIRSMLTLHILPNVTQGGRPYALIENVVTLDAWQRRGLARQVMEAAIAAAWEADAYKIMLLTDQRTTAREFYAKLGFDAEEKTGMTLRRAPKRRISGARD